MKLQVQPPLDVGCSMLDVGCFQFHALKLSPHEQLVAALADLFAEVANSCRSADGFLAEKSKATSPLVQVQLFERGQDWVEKLNGLQRKLNELREKLTTELKSLDAQWVSADAAARRDILPKLEELYRLFGYFNRWNNQIQERVVQLSF